MFVMDGVVTTISGHGDVVTKSWSQMDVVMKKLVTNGCGHEKLVQNNFPMKILRNSWLHKL